jgi:pimeloyl-[acyl-carrier protein] methyl ester esterase
MADGKNLGAITLVLLPGLDGTGELFANFLAELPKGMDVITLAFPSDQFLPYSELLPWLADRVPNNKPYGLLGESYGSPLAVKFAATHPVHLVGLILVVGFISNPMRKWGALPRLLARRFFFQFRPADFALEYFIAGAGAPKNILLAVNRATASVRPEILAERARAVIECDATQEIQQVKVPTLFLQASQDRLLGKECLEEIKRLHPETISISIRAPHLLLQREPRIAAQAVAQFLETECQKSGL